MKTKNHHVKAITISTLIAVGVVGSYLLYAYVARVFPFTAGSEYDVNYSRSDAEKQREQEIRDNPSQKLENDQTDQPSEPSVDTTNGKQSVSVLISYAGVSDGLVSASGLVTNLSQEGGQCTYIFTKGDKVLEKPVETMANPTSTTCKTIQFSASELTSGAWNIVLNYSSSNAYGESSRKTLVVP